MLQIEWLKLWIMLQSEFSRVEYRFESLAMKTKQGKPREVQPNTEDDGMRREEKSMNTIQVKT